MAAARRRTALHGLPYFTQSVTALLGVGVMLGAAIYYVVQAGW
jgi:hypothetical protein